MTTRVAINGLGRIGRAILKLVIDEPSFELVAVNDLVDAENLAYLLRFDTVYGRYSKSVVVDGDALVVAGRKLRTLSEPGSLAAAVEIVRRGARVRMHGSVHKASGPRKARSTRALGSSSYRRRRKRRRLKQSSTVSTRPETRPSSFPAQAARPIA